MAQTPVFEVLAYICNKRIQLICLLLYSLKWMCILRGVLRGMPFLASNLLFLIEQRWNNIIADILLIKGILYRQKYKKYETFMYFYEKYESMNLILLSIREQLFMPMIGEMCVKICIHVVEIQVRILYGEDCDV